MMRLVVAYRHHRGSVAEVSAADSAEASVIVDLFAGTCKRQKTTVADGCLIGDYSGIL